MSDLFDLPISYNEKELLFPAEFLPFGYSHKIKVTVNGTDLFFEPDEEKNYRAMISDTDREQVNKLDTNLLRTVCETLDELFGSRK